MSYHERDITMIASPYDGGGVNLNPRPIGRNPRKLVACYERKGGTQANELTRKNRAAIGETCKATAVPRTSITVGDGRSRLLYG